MQIVSIIVAAGENGVIGKGGKIPWRLPADMTRFKSVTMGHPVIMGRKTYESIGKPLPGRRNIVITRQDDYRAEGSEVARSLGDALKIAGDGEVFVIGGAEIYREALPLAKKLYLTQVGGVFEGDTYFPKIDTTVWHETSRTPGIQDEKNLYPHTFLIFERKK